MSAHYRFSLCEHGGVAPSRARECLCTAVVRSCPSNSATGTSTGFPLTGQGHRSKECDTAEAQLCCSHLGEWISPHEWAPLIARCREVGHNGKLDEILNPELLLDSLA